MFFGDTPVASAEGMILAHTAKGEGWTLKKGRRLTREDCTVLAASGITSVIVAKLEDSDVHEDDAAKRIAANVAGRHVSLTPAFTGRCNLIADTAGVVRIDAETINGLNAIDESVTIATLPDYAKTSAGQIVATIKIIPFAVNADTMAAVDHALTGQAASVSISPFGPRTVVLINTNLPSLKASVMAKTTELTTRRLTALGSTVEHVMTCRHAEAEVAEAMTKALSYHPDLVVVVGASVTVDRADVVPAGIVKAGGEITHFGMPVDPGNLMLLAHYDQTPVLVLPGCARSPKLNGIDWILERFAAGLSVTRKDITELGIGGLLVDSPARPLPREEAVREVPPTLVRPKVAAVVLAAGQSRRMGHINKLLELVDEVPLIRRVVETVFASQAAPVVVVTGYEAEEVKAALSALDVIFVHNPNYADGLSTSLKTGLAAVPRDCAAAVVCLGDMPMIAPKHIDALIERCDPEAGRAVGVPVHLGKRGNPVLWARRFFEAMTDVSGDVGARHLIGAHAELVYEVEFEDTAVLTDLDTPEEWSQFRET
jgi:molybdenum cofactor cytidylyltransferase